MLSNDPSFNPIRDTDPTSLAGERPVMHGGSSSALPWQSALQLYRRAMDASQCGIVIADMQQRDRPLIYCNPAFETITGYSRAEILGHNCRFLQGSGTDPAAVEQIRQAIAQQTECVVILRNYRKDGTPFWNRLDLSPVHDETGTLTHYIGVQTDISVEQEERDRRRRQLQGERLLQMVTQRIRQSLDLQEVLVTAVGEVRSLLNTDRVLIYCFESDWSGTVVAESVAEGWTSSLHLNIQDTCFQENRAIEYQRGRVLAIEDIEISTLSECHRQLLRRFEVRGNLVLPIMQRGQIWGLFIVHHCRAARRWQTFEVTWLERLTEQLAIALQQAELYSQAQAEIANRKRIEAELQASTAQLEAQAQQLAETLDYLKWHQARLLQSEKLSSLGQLVAGVAHEINNPISFIYGNLNYVQQYGQELLTFAQKYAQQNQARHPDLDALIEEIDLEFIADDLPKMTQSMRTGAERIRQIVRSLRTFSHLDEADCKAVDLHANLESMVSIVQSRLRGGVTEPEIVIRRDYGPVPELTCYPGLLNQAIVHILNNAIDALRSVSPTPAQDAAADGAQTRPGMMLGITPDWVPTIRLQTWVIGDRVQLAIANNGPTIPEAIRSKIFDPFFTTKPVGSGTGLGLSMTYQTVVERHQGRIACEIQEQDGTAWTCFVLELPVKVDCTCVH